MKTRRGMPLVFVVVSFAGFAMPLHAYGNTCDVGESPCLLETNDSPDAGIGLEGFVDEGVNGIGVYGSATGPASMGVYGTSDTGSGVYGTGSTGVYGTGTTNGVYGTSTGTGTNGVYGHATATDAFGVYGDTTQATGIGIEGYNSSNSSSLNYGVYGLAGGSGGIGVYGTGADGVRGQSSTGTGVHGISSANSNAGVVGYTTGTSGYGVEGECSGSSCSYGGYFSGGIYAGYFTGGSTGAAEFNGNINVLGKVLINGTCQVGCTSSDSRLKTDVEPLTGAVEQLLQLKGVSWRWRDPAQQGGDTGTQRGFIAQDVEKIFPKWVGEDQRGFKTLAIESSTFDALTVESIRTLKGENDELRKRVEALENNRWPVVSVLGRNGAGFGLAGLAIGAAAVVVGRRRRDDKRA